MFHFDTSRLVDPALFTTDFTTVHAYNGTIEHSNSVIKVLDAHTTHELGLLIQPLILGANHNHPNILQITGYDLHDHIDKIQSQRIQRLYVRLPRMADNLSNKISRYINEDLGSIPKAEIVSHLYDITKALEYLQKREIAHMNIKPSNILINSKGQALLTDIGLIRHGDKAHKIDKTYIAPELAENKLIEVVDISEHYIGDAWSLGLTILDLCLLNQHHKRHIGSPPTENDVKKSLGDVEKKYGKDLRDILENLLQREPGKRIGFSDLRQKLEESFQWNKDGSENQEGREERRLSVRSEKERRSTQEFVNRNIQEKREEERPKEKEADKRENMEEPEEVEGEEPEIDKRHTQIIDDLDLIKSELEIKWKDFFKLERGREWSIKVKDPTKLTDTEVDIFLFDVSDKFKEFGTTSIQNIDIDFSNCTHITDKGLGYLGVNVSQNFASCTILNLDFGGLDQITDKGISQLVDQMANSLKEIQDLTLDFSYWIKVTDTAFSSAMAEISQNLKMLKYLTLDLSYTNVSDKATTQMVTYIGHRLPELERLVLRFGGCFRVTDTGLSEIAKQASRNLKSLKHLELSYGFCMSISDKGLIELANNIPSRLTQLKHLAFDFGGCVNMTSKGFTELATHIAEHLKDLESLSLDFEGCSGVGEKAKNLLKKILDFVPRLSIK